MLLLCNNVLDERMALTSVGSSPIPIGDGSQMDPWCDCRRIPVQVRLQHGVDTCCTAYQRAGRYSITIGLLLAAVVDNATKDRDDTGSYRIPIAIQFGELCVAEVVRGWYPETNCRSLGHHSHCRYARASRDSPIVSGSSLVEWGDDPADCREAGGHDH